MSKIEKRQFTAEYKARIVLEILKETETLSEIAARESISRPQLQNWKKEFTQNAALVFSQNKIERQAKQEIRGALEREEFIKSRLDYWHTMQCCLGVRGLRTKLRKENKIVVGHKLIKRYMEEIGIRAVYPKPNLSKANKQHKKYPYLLRNIVYNSVLLLALAFPIPTCASYFKNVRRSRREKNPLKEDR